MAVEMIDAPGEYYNDVYSIWNEISGTIGFATIDGRRCFAMPPGGFVRRWLSVGSATDVVFHAEVRFTSNSDTGTYQLFRALDGAAHHFHLQRNSDGKAQVNRDTTAVATTGTSVFPIDTWLWVSFAVHIADVGGTWEVKVNGTTVLSGTGDTRNGSSGTATKMQIGNEQPGISGNPNVYVRDVIFLTGTVTPLAKRRVAYIGANNPGHDTNWTPSAGANWQNVDERDGAPDEDTTYNSETTVDEDDLYHLAPLPSSAESILAVTDIIRLRKVKESKQIAQRKLRTNNNEYESGDLGLPMVGYQWFSQGVPRETNPQTSAAWTENEVNRLQVGVIKK